MARELEIGGLAGMDFTIDRRAEVPIGVQLTWALRARIGDGRLTAGQRLPGLRDLAQVLKINANTVRAVYQRLEHEGLIESQQGSGTYVAANPRLASAAGKIAASAAREAEQTGVDPREVAAALYVEHGSHEPANDRAVLRRRELRTQIAALEQVLAKIEADRPELATASRAATQAHGPRADDGPRLLSVAELESIQSQLIRRLAGLQLARDERDSGEPVAPVAAVVPDTQREAAAAKRPAPRKRAKTRPALGGA